MGPGHRALIAGSCCAFTLAALPLSAAAGALDVRALDAKGRALPDTIVWLESADAKKQTKPLAGIEVAQVNRQFVPEVSVVTVGTSVSFPNRDTVRHHVYSFSETKRFEIKLYVGTPTQPVVFDQPGIAVLGCNIHDTMAAWIVVVDTPWHGRAGADGRWQIANVPDGAYRLRAWHAAMPHGAPALDQPLRVDAAGASATVTLAVTAP